MASEAEFSKEMQPPDIEEVKVVSSSKNQNVENTGPAPKDNIRHSAEKLDEDTVRMAINNLFAPDHLEPNRVRK